jgi:cation diffusion facilitator family transporter
VRGHLTQLLARVGGHSHDAADALDEALTGSRRGIRALKVSLLVLLLTAFLQAIVVVVSGSVALLADTVHNLGDALTAVPLWVAFAVGTRPATRRYTFGYRRAEDVAGLFVLLMILLSAVLAARESLERLMDPQPIGSVPVVIAAGLIGFAGNEAVAWYRIRVGRQIGSAALVADGYHARTDGLTSLAVVAGALGVAAGFPVADPLVGLLISGVIVVVLVQAARQVFGRFMDAVEPQLVDEVEAVARDVPGVQGLGPVRLRWVGHGLEASLSITVDCAQSVAYGHRVAEEVRHALLHRVRRLDTAIIHVDPCEHDGDDAHAMTRHHDTPATAGAGARTSAGEPATGRSRTLA